MAEILKGATLVEFSPPKVERADLAIEGNRIVARAPDLAPGPEDRVTDLSGRLLMPGLVDAHAHLYAALARGMPPPREPPRNFMEILRGIWWKLDRALDEEAVEIAARISAAEALLAGVTTVIDHHASPAFIEGSLFAVRRGIDAVGLRSVLSYEITDRHGPEGREAGLRESESFLRTGQTSRCRALVGGHASMTLEPETLEAMGDLAQRYDSGVHLHVAEHPDDERDCREKYGVGLIDRLHNNGLLGPRTLLAHCTHLAWEELSLAQQSGTWLLHCPRSNMNNGVGYAPAGRFGARKALGTHGVDADMLAEARAAWFRGRDAGLDIDVPRWLSGGHLLASELFGAPLGKLEVGALADLVVLDYPSPTPLVGANLAGHLVFGIQSGHVDAAMVDGVWRLWARQLLSVDQHEQLARSREVARRVWGRMQEL